MEEPIRRGDKVMWENGRETMSGHVIDTFLQSGTTVTANSNMQNMASRNALLVELSDGSKVLKLEHEVKRG